MNIREKQLWINDYLDLYLYAGSMDDIFWQQEIIEKLQKYHNEIKKETQFSMFNKVIVR